MILCITPSEEPNPKQTGQVLTVPIMHQFPSKQWQQTGTSNTVLLSSLTHDDVTHRFFDSEREAFPRFWGAEVPRPIHHALCANDRLMQTRHQEQSEAAGMKRSESTVRGCDLKDCKAVIRIFNQDFHNPSRYKGKGGTHVFLHQPFLLWAKRVLRH